MAVTAKQVKELREETGLPMMQCKRALVETDGDLQKAMDYLRKQGAKMAEKRAHRETLDGAIGMYVHHDGKLGVMVELNCETTPVAKTDAFRELAKEIAMHVAVYDPLAVSRDQVDEATVAKEREIILGQMEQDEKMKSKPDQIKEKIAEGKLDKFFAERVLMEQQFVKDDKLTVTERLQACVQQTGENVGIGRIVRFKVGER